MRSTRVGPEARDRVLGHVAIAAEELQAGIGHAAEDFGGVQLERAYGLGCEFVAFVGGDAGVQEGLGGGDVGRALRQREARVLDLGTVGQLWRLYSESPDYKALAEITRKQYAEYWGRLAKVWERGVVRNIKPADVNKYLRVYRKDVGALANREVALLSNLFNLAVETGEIDRNPCKEVQRNKERPRTRLVEAHELEAFVDWAMHQGRPYRS